MSARFTQSVTVAVFATLCACSSTERALVLDVSQIPTSAEELVVRVTIANKTSEANVFPLPKGHGGAPQTLAVRVPKDSLGWTTAQVVARAGGCDIAGINNFDNLTNATPETEKILMPLAPAVGPFPVCNFDRAPLMAYVQAGSHIIGCDTQSDPSCASDEGPTQTVSLPPFQIDATEVLVGAYRDCVTAGACTPALSNANTVTITAQNGVDWGQASAFCKWMGKQLPTEAQWGAAARGTDDRTYPWGNDAPTCDLAEYAPTTNMPCSEDGGAPPYAAGKREAGRSPYGAYDMAGNLDEWVADWYAPVSSLSAQQIVDGGPSSGTFKIVKGGGAFDPAVLLRIASRIPIVSDGSQPDAGRPAAENLPLLGFRCALSR